MVRDPTAPTMSMLARRILVLGGTGRTGRLVIVEALKRGFKVTALVRDISTLQEMDGMTVVQGTPTNLEDLQRAVKASTDPISAIVSTLGQTRKTGNPWSAVTSPPGFIAKAISNCIEIAEEAQIAKLVIMSAWGTGDSFKSLNFLMRLIMNYSNMAQTLEDHNLVDKVVKESNLNFVLVRATMLKDGATGPIRRLGDGGEQAPFTPSISPDAVARFLLDAVESDQWDKRTPVISA
jgi:putative NADH-flavin reductase